MTPIAEWPFPTPGGATVRPATPTAATPATQVTTATPTAPPPPPLLKAKPHELPRQPALSGAVTLGDFGGAQVSVQPNGQLALGAVPTSLSEQIRAVKVAVTQAPDNQPFANITDKATLRAASVSSAQLFTSLLKTPRNDGEALEFRAGRAAALALMEAAARRAGALGDTGLRDALTLGMLFSVAQEPYRPLKDFAYESTLQRAAKGELPRTESAEAALYPQKPPYAQWLKDGKISVVHYTDNSGSPREGNVTLYTDRGFTRQDNPDGSTLLTRKKEGDLPHVEVLIPKAPTHDAPPSLFEKMGDDSVDMIIYAGHAGYGRRVDDALAKGVTGTGDGKLVTLLQCSGEGSIESIKRSFPGAQLISTREMSDDNYDFEVLAHLFDGVDEGSSYDTISQNNTEAFDAWVAELQPPQPGEVDAMSAADIKWYKDHPMKTHFFFPNSRDVLLSKMDRDRDGVTDKGDTMFNVVFPKRVDGTGGYDPLDPGAPLDGLDGTALNSSVNQLNLIARYAVLPQGLLNNVPWNPDAFVSVGFFEPTSSSDLKAYKFTVDPTAGKIKVALNANFAHAPKEALARMMAVEAGQFLSAQAGMDATNASTFTLAMLERIRHQEGTPSNHSYSYSNPVEGAAIQEELFRRRYGLDLTFRELFAASGNPDDFVVATWDALKAKVAASPELQALAQAAPKRATEAIAVPDNLQVASYLDTAAQQALLTRLGVQGTVQQQASSYASGLYARAGSRVAIQANDSQNNPFYVALGIDSEGIVRAASKVGIRAVG